MRVGVIGAGSMGRILAHGLARLGHQAAIAASRGPELLVAAAAEVGATAASVEGAVSAADLVILAIPTKAVPLLPPGLFRGLAAAAVVVDLAVIGEDVVHRHSARRWAGVLKPRAVCPRSVL